MALLNRSLIFLLGLQPLLLGSTLFALDSFGKTFASHSIFPQLFYIIYMYWQCLKFQTLFSQKIFVNNFLTGKRKFFLRILLFNMRWSFTEIASQQALI